MMGLSSYINKLYDCMDYISKEKSLLKISGTYNLPLPMCKSGQIRYKGAPLDLVKKMKLEVELEKVKVQMLIQNNKQLTSFIDNIQASNVWLFSNLMSW